MFYFFDSVLSAKNEKYVYVIVAEFISIVVVGYNTRDFNVIMNNNLLVLVCLTKRP